MNTLIRACVVVGLIAIAVAAASAQDQQAPSPRAERQRVLIEQTRWEKGIPAAAAITGRYSGGEVGRSENVPTSAATIASFSDVVVLAQAVSGKPFLTDDQKHISTEYQVKVQRVFQDRTGEVKPGAVLALNLPGGQITLDDGAIAETRAADVESMREGGTYVLFLQHIDQPNVAASVGKVGSYRLAFRSEGMYEVVPKERSAQPGLHVALKASGKGNTPAARELTAGSADDPFAKIAQAVSEAAQYPDPRKQP